MFDPFNLLSLHEREYAIASVLRELGIGSLNGRKVLDVGCGRGRMLRWLLEFGADPSLIYGLDLVDIHLAEARHRSPHLSIVRGNAAELPFGSSSFDLVHQATVFSSVLDPLMKRTIASEMLRVLKSDGFILWYDFFADNPRNPDVRGVSRKEIHDLFPTCRIQLRRLTVAPPIGRVVARYSPLLYEVLSRTKILCTHYLCVIAKG